MTSMEKEELTRCEGRIKRLAQEKSYLQLVNNLMMQLSHVKGVESVVEKILSILLDNLGGSNLLLYYSMGSELWCVDAYGEKRTIEQITDETVQRAFTSREFVEVVYDFERSKMMTPEFTKASCWAVPLLVDNELVGVLKLDDVLMATAEVRTQLELFFRYAALVLKNEISNYAILHKAYDALTETNAQLTKEIRQRTEAENSLRITQFAVDHASDCLFWITPDARFANANDSACRRLGYSRDELLTLTVFDVDPEFPAESWGAHWLEIKERKTFTIETKHKTKSGEIFPVEVTVNYAEYEGAAYNFAFARDISDRKRAEEALHSANRELEQAVAARTLELENTLVRLRMELEERRRVEEKLLITQFSVDNSADVIFWVRPDGSFSNWNKAACDLLNYSSQDLAQLKAFDLNPEHRGAAWLAHWRELKQQGSLRFEAVLGGKDGMKIPVEITANHVVFNDQEYNCSFVRDISERKQMDEELKKHREHLEVLVKERTAEIEQQKAEVDRMNKLFVGRELRMIELKAIIKKLEARS